ncbi:Glutamine--tRNA ligase [Candidatus Ecksteinia adelgidicola]|nr:Glutamine--tRNA ligase [Candidatus Ecksteinia adelgidicola]
MSNIKAYQSSFIYQIINKDLEKKNMLIRTRFSPDPNGYLHIGHAKSICLNFNIAKDYNGHCNLRFDDTNPLQENAMFIKKIKQDIEWLGFKWDGCIHYASDYFDQLYEYALELISKNLAYVDELSPEKISEYRGGLTKVGRNSPYRTRSIEENLLLFKKMRDGKFFENQVCLRAKIDMNSPFIVMRDPVLYRIKFIKHYKTGNKWCIYPMYDFAHSISDAIEGITHSLCTLEFQDNRRLYEWILNHITINCRPYQYEFSRLNLEYNITSKRKLKKLVMKKYVDGWDDPRMPTISGMRRRGYTSFSIRQFCQRLGITKKDNNIEISSLESCVRNDLNHCALRVMAVLEPVKVIIENMTEKEQMLTILNHPNKPDMGTRQVLFSKMIYIDRADFREKAEKEYKRLTLNQKVRLRNAYVIQAIKVERDVKGIITAIFCRYDPETLNKNPNNGHKIKNVIHWVSCSNALPAEIRLYNHLFTVSNPTADINFLSTINPESLIIKNGFVESSLALAKSGQVYQFEREGYFCVDFYCAVSKKLVFNRTIKLRDSKTKF